jgi:crotonobetainyl-CoA:carnitine CoA-transferase CaiB-like acyl-CoA transferase/putative sterol carrier protein
MSTITARQILLSIPSRFRPEKAQDYSTVFHFDITGKTGGQFTIIIKHAQCKLLEGFHETANCIVKTNDQIYVDLETGRLNPQIALITGKVKVSNIAEMMQFAKCFKKFDPNSTYTATDIPAAEATGLKEYENNMITDNISAVPQETKSRPEKQGPLKGLRVLDFTRLLPGPLATQMLAEMGADVVKIEDPDAPDYIRNFTPLVEQQSAYYLALNRSKKSLAINYTSEKGREIIHKLAQKADVLIEQFRPGIMDKLGLGYEKLKTINPRLVFVSITGYGQSGPLAHEAGHDLNYIAMAGLLSITGDPTKPVIPGGQIADVAAGSYMAVSGTLAALYAREKTGKGQHVDVAMTDAVLPVITLQYAYYKAEKKLLPAGTFELSGGLANYNVYQCADDKWIALGALEPKFWNNFCDMVSRPEWKNNILLPTHEMELFKKTVAELFKTKTRQEWLIASAGKDVCLTPVLQLDELEHHPHHIYRKNFSEDYFAAILQPIQFSESEKKSYWASPPLGADNSSIFNDWGIC